MIELIMVIVVLGILSASASSLFSGRSAYDERFFYEDVLAGLRHAHKLAMSTGCGVEFDRTASGFTLKQDANCFSAAAGSYTLAIFKPGDSVGYTVGDSTAIWTSTVDPLIFSAEGQVTNTAGTIQTATTLTVGGRTITVDGQTGYVR